MLCNYHNITTALEAMEYIKSRPTKSKAERVFQYIENDDLNHQIEMSTELRETGASKYSFAGIRKTHMIHLKSDGLVTEERRGRVSDYWVIPIKARIESDDEVLPWVEKRINVDMDTLIDLRWD